MKTAAVYYPLKKFLLDDFKFIRDRFISGYDLYVFFPGMTEFVFDEKTNTRRCRLDPDSRPFDPLEPPDLDWEDTWEGHVICEIENNYTRTMQNIKECLNTASSEFERMKLLRSLLDELDKLTEQANKLQSIENITMSISDCFYENLQFIRAFLVECQGDIESIQPGSQVDKGPFSYPLKNINKYQYNLSDVLAELIDKKFIDQSTKISSLIKIFQRQDRPIGNKIIWTGTKEELAYFIKLLYDNYLIEPSEKVGFKWKIAPFCFKFTKESDMDYSTLRLQHPPKLTASVLEKIVQTLKKALNIQ